GSRRWSFGEGTVEFEPFLAAGAAWRGALIQGDVRLLLPTKIFPTERVRRLGYNISVSHLFSGSPRGWGIGIEMNGVDSAVGVTPYVLKGLTRTGALTAAIGVRLPLTNPFPYDSDLTRWSGYLVWDFREPLRSRP
ncbi:MAG: hypothetical protein ABIS29_04990, partial [Vicinamibacterales bacterium]